MNLPPRRAYHRGTRRQDRPAVVALGGRVLAPCRVAVPHGPAVRDALLPPYPTMTGT
jgi:hypothetical protein